MNTARQCPKQTNYTERRETLYRLLPVDDKHFTIAVPVEVSPPFYAWVATFGRRMKILGPEAVVEGMKDFIRKVSSMYEDE